MSLVSFNKNKSPIERFLEHLDRIFKKEPEFYSEDSLIDGISGVTSIVYQDIPEMGYITALTYGLSLVAHEDWKFGRPELCISVESSNIDWGQVVGYIANKLRGTCAFCYGQTINFNEKISNDSEMDAFFVFGPSIFEKEDYLNIDIGTDYKINIAGLYPMYSTEIEIFEKIGIKEFWHHRDFDLYSVNRNKITL